MKLRGLLLVEYHGDVPPFGGDLEGVPLATGLGLPDALIAAIALEGDHTLVTSNLRHFRFIAGLRLEQAPYRVPQSDSSP